ncbi:hypothetical protein EJ04DRAFT_510602 [Polyplosphaeria fusca]|uniref:Tudor domain-containing protein n=1 Tax=Polyplosphaeria fusca TaxID=682080 RepID=A0A9P4V3T5_9PLEO|nr:hypothetical protein EJ04DRAFT_510602 [Polyplosphaeria fusca]
MASSVSTKRETLNKIKALEKELAVAVDAEKKSIDTLETLENFLQSPELIPKYHAYSKEINATLADQRATVAKLNAEIAQLQATLPKKEGQTEYKFDVFTHPILGKQLEPVEEGPAWRPETGTICKGKWEEDGQWYTVKILTILGSSAFPKYRVQFVDYQEGATLDPWDLRPFGQDNNKKRKADAMKASSTAPVSTPAVISAPATKNLPVKKSKIEHDPDADRTHRRIRKIGGNNRLTKNADNWKDYLSKGKGKAVVGNKKSMFSTSNDPKARVGVTGSGKTMTANAPRVRVRVDADAIANEAKEGNTAIVELAKKPAGKMWG